MRRSASPFAVITVLACILVMVAPSTRFILPAQAARTLTGVTAPATLAPSGTLGSTTVTGGGWDKGGDNNDLDGIQVATGPQGGTASGLSAYVGNIDPAAKAYGIAIYSDSGGQPGTLVASGTGSLTSQGWNTLPLAATLAPNTAYWLVYNTATSNAADNVLYVVAGSPSAGGWSVPVACCAFPATAPAWTHFGNQYAIYAMLATSTGASPTGTNTAVPPTNTSTQTPAPPTATGTTAPPSSTKTPIPATGTSTNTPVPPTATSTKTPIPATATSTSTPVPGGTLGYTTTAGGQFDTGNNNNLSAVRVATGTGGASVSSMSVYVGPIDTSNPGYGLAIYADSGGFPYGLVASASGSLSGSGWNTLPIAATLAPNTTYWLVYNSATSNNSLDEVYFVNGAAGIGDWSPPVTCCVFPASQTGWTATNMQYAMYATLGIPGPTATRTATSVPGSATSTPVPATATGTKTPVPSGTPSGQLVFDDEFSGPSLDSATWTALNRPGDSSNSEQQCYKPSNAGIVSGALVLTDRQDSSCSGYSYTSAMVQTRGFNFTYGTFEVRAQMPKGGGQWPALWLLGANCQATNPTSADNSGACQWPTPGSNEIDLFEGLGAASTQGWFSLNTGTSPNSDNQFFSCAGVSLPFDLSTALHTYDLIWRPGSLTWQVDGHTYCSTAAHVPSTPMFILLNIALGGQGGAIDPSVLPQSMHIDYVRVYQ